MKREFDITIVFPSDFLKNKVIDPDLKEEYESVLRCDQFSTVIFGNREWFDEEKLILTEERETPVRAIYRGWMMTPELYENQYAKKVNQTGSVYAADVADLREKMDAIYDVGKIVLEKVAMIR